MQKEDKGLIEAFRTAIEMEEKGRQFYLKLAKRSSNDLAKRVFEALADDETRHIIAIKGYCENIHKKEKVPKLCAVMPDHKRIKEKIIFERHQSDMIKSVPVNADELAAYETALKMENEGYKYYKKSLDLAKDSDVKELYKFLISEEEAHSELISNTYEYLKDPAAWFAKDEGLIVEG